MEILFLSEFNIGTGVGPLNWKHGSFSTELYM